MENPKKILFLALLLLPFVLLFSACDSPPHPKKQKTQNIITKKILPVEQKTNTGKKAKPETVNAKPPKEAKDNIPKKVEINTANKAKPDNKNSSRNNNLKADIESDKEIKYYISEGKLDPFASPIAKENNKKRKKTIDRKLTPLEKLDLSQIKLVAVITMQSKKKNVAMVQESSGKGYMVKVGTYIGTNNGRIIKIKNDEIIIKERIKNFKGIFEDQLKPMKLQKKDNG